MDLASKPKASKAQVSALQYLVFPQKLVTRPNAFCSKPKAGISKKAVTDYCNKLIACDYYDLEEEYPNATKDTLVYECVTDGVFEMFEMSYNVPKCQNEYYKYVETALACESKLECSVIKEDEGDCFGTNSFKTVKECIDKNYPNFEWDD